MPLLAYGGLGCVIVTHNEIIEITIGIDAARIAPTIFNFDISDSWTNKPPISSGFMDIDSMARSSDEMYLSGFSLSVSISKLL